MAHWFGRFFVEGLLHKLPPGGMIEQMASRLCLTQEKHAGARSLVHAQQADPVLEKAGFRLQGEKGGGVQQSSEVGTNRDSEKKAGI